MKKTLLLIMLSISLFSFDKYKQCTDVANLAESTMKTRQQGVDIEIIIKWNNNYPNKRNLPKWLYDKIHKLNEDIILDAYKYKIYEGENRNKIMKEFREKWYIKCIEENGFGIF